MKNNSWAAGCQLAVRNWPLIVRKTKQDSFLDAPHQKMRAVASRNPAAGQVVIDTGVVGNAFIGS